MPNQLDLASHSHCVVQWEDAKDQYAIVDIKRAKTVASLKIGHTTLFEGYQRERRRGKILFLAIKKDCFAYGFDIVEDDSRLNTYSWSGPPGLREQSEEMAQAIRHGGSSSFQRTTSSSSASSITVLNQQKRKKLASKSPIDVDERTALNDTSMPPPTSTSPVPITETTNSVIRHVVDNQPSSSKNLPSSSSSIGNSVSTNTEKNSTAPSHDIDSLLAENQALREKVLMLEDQLLYQRETSISLPSEEAYNYVKSICSMWEQIKAESSNKAMEIGKSLPCTKVELRLAKKSNPSTTINNLVQCCFENKDIVMKDMSYEKLKAIDSELLKKIHEYVTYVHAPVPIPQAMFSGTISLKCRHLREDDKYKNGAPNSTKRKRTEKQKRFQRSNDNENQNENIPEASNEVIIEDVDDDKENSSNAF